MKAAFGPRMIAGHRVESLVGRGGMGVVYRATDLSLERPVALELIARSWPTTSASARVSRASRGSPPRLTTRT
jgi:hypothetical protein